MPLEVVDWAKVDEKLPTACTPAGQAARKEIFDGIDNSGNGTLSLTECNSSLPPLVSGLVKNRDFRPAIKCSFKAARDIHPSESKPKSKAAKEADDMIDRSEFHALLVAFRHYLELDVLFSSIDSDGSKMISWKELEKILPKLEDWNLGDKKLIKKKFPDEWTESMKYQDFADWALARRMGGLKLKLDENDAGESLKADVGGDDAGSLLKAFSKWDTDGSQSISEDEMFAVLNQLDPNFTRDMAKELFAAADSNSDGKIDYVEFTKWVTG
jgi:Ca2+-binding EF-hand superfamily protein